MYIVLSGGGAKLLLANLKFSGSLFKSVDGRFPVNLLFDKSLMLITALEGAERVVVIVGAGLG
jgi:hypothetical protein